MKISSMLWFVGFFIIPILVAILACFAPPPYNNMAISWPFILVYLILLILLLSLGYSIKNSVAEDLSYLNNQYFANENTSFKIDAIVAVKIENCDRERMYYVYGTKHDDPIKLTYYSEGVLKGAFSCIKKFLGLSSIVYWISIFLIFSLYTRFVNTSISALSFFGIFISCGFIFSCITGAYFSRNNHKRSLKFNNLTYKKHNLAFIIRKDVSEEFEKKFEIDKSTFNLITDNSDYRYYFRKNNI